MPQIVINYWAVLVAAVSSQIIGMLWYSQKFFGPAWIKAIGWDPQNQEQMARAKKQATPAMATGFLLALIMAYVMAHFVGYVGVTSLVQGVQLGFWLWLGFVATVTLTNIMYEVRPKNLFVINAGYFLATLVVMGAILSVWR